MTAKWLGNSQLCYRVGHRIHFNHALWWCYDLAAQQVDQDWESSEEEEEDWNELGTNWTFDDY